MKFKEFVNWCNDRACDGRWGFLTATVCIDIIQAIRKEPFWKREKAWRTKWESQVVYEIVNPINEKIKVLAPKED
jgi:hypothetical protein